MTMLAVDAPDDRSLVDSLATMTYAEVAVTHGVSRGRVYAAAVRLGARKHEYRNAGVSARRVNRPSWLKSWRPRTRPTYSTFSTACPTTACSCT
jgi:hypothetical protein